MLGKRRIGFSFVWLMVLCWLATAPVLAQSPLYLPMIISFPPPINITNHPAWEYSPTWSPDGNRIAFVSERDGNPELFVMDPDGSHVTQLTHDLVDPTIGWYMYPPVWSPNGEQITFGLQVVTYDTGGVPHEENRPYVINADGSGLVRIGTGRSLSWSPDGSRLVIGGPVIHVVNADGTNRVNLDVHGYDFTWSPKDDRIAFWLNIASNRDSIAVVTADGAGNTVLTNPAEFEFDRYPAWSPDGERIAYVHAGASIELYIINADGSDAVRLNNLRYILWRPAWSPRDDKLAFYGDDRPLNMDTQPGLFVVDSDGANLTRVSDSLAGTFEPVPSWSPDGTMIVFSGPDTGEIHVVNVPRW